MGNTTKLAGVAGITWASANVALGFGTGLPPKLDASGDEVASHLANSRGAYLAALAELRGDGGRWYGPPRRGGLERARGDRHGARTSPDDPHGRRGRGLTGGRW